MPFDSDMISAMPMMPMLPAKAVSRVLAFFVIRLFMESARAVAEAADVLVLGGAVCLVLGLMHGIFMVPVCYFPWMIYGVDRIFDKKRPLVFILSTAAAAATTAVNTVNSTLNLFIISSAIKPAK